MNRLTKKHHLLENPILSFFKRNSGIIAALVLLCLILTFSVNTFLTADNILSVLRQVSINAILAIAMTFVLIIGCIDLSVGSGIAATSCLAALLISSGVHFMVAIAAALAMGVAYGFINGFLVSQTRIPSFIVTLAMMSILRGTAYVMTDGKAIMTHDEVFNSLGNGYVGPIPAPVILVAIIVVITSIILGRTRFGRKMYATGGNKEAALYAGINIKMITLSVYMISGLLTAIAGVLLASRIYSGQPTAGQGYEGDAIAAAVLGGTSFSGGTGTIGGTVIGALLMGVLSNGLNLLGVQFYWQFIVKGIVIILAVYIDTLKYSRLLQK